MSSAVASHIRKVLCKNQGCLDFNSLYKMVRLSYTVDDQTLVNVLSDGSSFVIVKGSTPSANSILSPDSLIIAKTLLRICQNPPDKCEQCETLHLCRYFVCGGCKYGDKCKHSHKLDSAHNSALLHRAGLQNLNETELFQLLLQNDPQLLPEVCPHYNKGNGDHGSCRFKAACTNLHICQHFLQDDCKFRAECKRAHAFDEKSTKILSGKNLSSANIDIIYKIYKNKLLITHHKEKTVLKIPEKKVKEHPKQSSSTPISDADRNEICLFFIRRGCSFKDKCVRVHHHLPYKWQVSGWDRGTWKDLTNGEEIEKAFCNPACDRSSGNPSVDFKSVTCGGSSVRRLSTASSVTKPPNFILTTEWCWYWKNDKGGWTEYGQGDPRHMATITSQTLENVYLDSGNEITFTAAKDSYKLYFKGMYQQNLKTNKTRPVRRRPRFVSAQDVEHKLKRYDFQENSGSSSVDVPDDWDKEALPSFTYKTVPLPRNGEKFKWVADQFKRTMSGSTIRNIQRVQNPSLWKIFQWQKEQMIGKNRGKEVDERYLFHGTDQSVVDAICEQNFDWRVCGAHGTVYGKGSYFARDASYSNGYAKTKNGIKMMFLAHVLVGDFAKGNSGYCRPPQKAGGNGFYDSCVNNEQNPSIFVIFEKCQIYPEFIIEYS
ncbi:protein mono-ADP-ribosyltransferase PARP12-like [Chanos chanos]|uniref:Protein mono-ADP-ribosyltransferase PARP12-like n=1 Tax=Chanos chanos TaxID=29144 RepID=A0A6J2WJU0_CHACN|nr:protein mono-ADP-ribosyltransferase PARP12-like [Chanos chanos]